MSKNQLQTNNFFSLVAIGIFIFMSTLDTSIVNMSLPVITKSLDISTHQSTWIITIPLIFISGFLILFGRLGDIFGKVKIFKIGTLFFILGSLMSGLSPNLPMLLASRIFQALGSAMTMSQGFGITSMIFAPDKRAKAISVISLFVSLGAVTGPGIGGLILQNLHYNYIFFLNIPLGLIAIYLGYKLLPTNEPTNKAHIDIYGFIIFFIFMVSLFFAIESIIITSSFYPYRYIVWVNVILFFSFFIYTQMKNKDPLLDLSIFKNILFSISVIESFLIFVTSFFVSVLLPFYLQELRGFDPAFSGWILMLWPITMIFIAPLSGYLSDKYNKETIILVSCIFILIAQILFFNLDAQSSLIYLSGAIILNSIGSTMFQTPNNTIIMNSVDSKYLGIAGSINALARNLGILVGVSLASATAFNAMSEMMQKPIASFITDEPDVFMFGLHSVFKLGMILLACIILMRTYRKLSF